MTWLKTHVECPCGMSSDAYAEGTNGWGKCFSCDKSFPPDGAVMEDTRNLTYDYYEHRNLNKKTLEFYNVVTEFADNEPFKVGFVYPNGATKFRLLEEKKFFSEGPMGAASLFGMDKFDPGGKSTVIITEGEYDALSAYQMLNGKVAAVSIRSSSSARADCDKARAWLNSFDKIVLCLDNDTQGKKATKQISGLFDYQKVFTCQMTKHKDASDYLQAGDYQDFVSVFNKAKRFTPESIVNSFADIKALLKDNQTEQVGSFPFEELNAMTYGLRKGDMILMKGLEGIGKTEVCRAIIHNNLKHHNVKMATIFLEETESTTIKGVATYELEQPAMLPDSGLSHDDIMEGYKKAVKDDEARLYIHKHFSSEDEGEIIDNIRFLVVSAGCGIVFLDNLTMLTTGREGEDERMRIDRITRRLRDLVNELGFCLILVAHVNDIGQTRGSRLPDKISNTVLRLERDLTSADENERRTTKMTLEKTRLGGKTGPAGKAFFDTEKYILRNLIPEDSISLP